MYMYICNREACTCVWNSYNMSIMYILSQQKLSQVLVRVTVELNTFLGLFANSLAAIRLFPSPPLFALDTVGEYMRTRVTEGSLVKAAP